MQSLFGKELPVTECLVTFFSSDIFGLNSSFKYFFVRDFFSSNVW